MEPKNKMYQMPAVGTRSETKEKYIVSLSEVDHVKYPEVMQKYRFEPDNGAGALMMKFELDEKYCWAEQLGSSDQPMPLVILLSGDDRVQQLSEINKMLLPLIAERNFKVRIDR